jgi:pimeloyl-ACP methyl ester carboxylesterase
MPSRRHFLGMAAVAIAASTARGLADDPPQDLLFIHGRGQGASDPTVLQSQWMDILRRGAQTLGRTVPSTVSVGFPFYGKVLDELANAANLPLTADIQTRGAAPDNGLLAFQDQVAEDIRARTGITDQEILDELGPQPQEHGPLNWAWVLAILRAIDKHAGGLSQTAIEEFTRDVYLYVTRAGVRDAIDAIVRTKLTERPTVVVAHSLGSVVAYNVLRTDPRNLNIPLLVTVGCPLGIRAIRNQLIPLKFPKPIHTWYNAFDTRDVVALFPLDGDNFPVTPAVTNFNGVKNHTDDRHGIDGYLDDGNVATHILDVLAG